MIPPDAPSPTPPRQAVCALCDGPLGGNQLRCDACIAAAHRAIARARGGVVRPSDILRERGLVESN